MNRKIILVLIGLPVLATALTYPIWSRYIPAWKSSVPVVVHDQGVETYSPSGVVDTEVPGPGTFIDKKTGLTFRYSSRWSMSNSWNEGSGSIQLYHRVPGEGSNESFGPDESEIQLFLTDDPSFPQNPGDIIIKKTTTINGQKAYFGIFDPNVPGDYVYDGGDPNPSWVYMIEVPSHPGKYLLVSMDGYATQQQFDELVQTITWTK